MNIVRYAVTAALFLLSAACVTEGQRITEPASPLEAAQTNLALGIGYIEQNRPDLALDPLRRAIELQPRLANAQSALALAYDMTGDFELAEEHHRRATQLAPNEPNTQNSFAVFLCRNNRWREAEPYFDRAVDNIGRASPVSVINNAGTCASAAGDLTAAETQYRRALDVEGTNPDSLRGIIEVMLRAENYLGARAFWQRLQASSTLAAPDLLNCVRIETRLGDPAAANVCSARLRREYPGAPELGRLGEIERSGG